MSTSRARIRSTHREAGATEVLIASANRYALMHELRGAPEPVAAELLEKLSPVDLVIVEGWKSRSFPKIEVYRQENGKPPLHPDDPYIVGVASDVPLPDAAGRSSFSTISMRSSTLLLAQALPISAHRHRRALAVVMAQLTDDCFAFSGPLLPIDDMERMIAERIVPLRGERKRCARAARGRVLAQMYRPASICRRSTIPRSMAMRCARRSRSASETRLAVVDRIMAGTSASQPLRPGRQSAFSPARRCRTAPTPSSCRRMCARKITP